MDAQDGEDIDLQAEGKPYKEPDLKTTAPEVLRKEIDTLITDLKERADNGTDNR